VTRPSAIISPPPFKKACPQALFSRYLSILYTVITAKEAIGVSGGTAGGVVVISYSTAR